MLSVGVLGPALTSLPLGEYFSSEYTRGYFSNLALYITYHLPGVFATNRVPYAVNGSLWTLPVEFAMYLGLTLLGFFRWPKWGYILISIVFMALIAGWAVQGTEQLVVYRSDIRQARDRTSNRMRPSMPPKISLRNHANPQSPAWPT